MIKSIIFDFSGVLSDDLLSTYKAAMDVLDIRGIKRITFEEFKDFYVIPWDNFYKNMGVYGIDLEEEYAIWNGISSKYSDLVVPMKGAKEVLIKLHGLGIRSIVLSSRDKLALELDIKNHGFSDLIDDVLGDVHDKKEVIGELIQKNNFQEESTIYVGDLPYDIETAHHAGVRSVAVLSGFGKKDELLAEKPDFVIEDISKLIGLVESIK